MRSIIAAFLIIGCLASSAMALPSGATFTFVDPIDEYGGASSIPTTSPWGTIDPSVWSIVCGAVVPWKPTGTTGCYFHAVPSGHGGENPGPSLFTLAGRIGNPSQGLVEVVPFRAATLPASSAAIFLFCDSTAPQGARGTDQTFLALTSTGTLNFENSVPTLLANSHISLTANTWYFLAIFLDVGLNSTLSWQQGAVSVVIYDSTGAQIDNFGCGNCVTQGITPQIKSLLVDQIDDDAEFDNTYVGDYGPPIVVNPGGNTAASVLNTLGPQRIYYTSPNADSKPLQYSVTGVTSHFQAVSSIPPNTLKYISTATQGNQDAFLANFPSGLGPTITFQGIQSVQESDAAGQRLGTDFLQIGSANVTGSMCSLSNGTYGWCESIYTSIGSPHKVGAQLGW